MDVRLVTLNLQALHNGWFEGRFDAVVRGLERHKPDVLCLQEAIVSSHGSSLYDQAHAVGDALGLHFVAFDAYGAPDHLRLGYQEGLAVVSRWPLARVRDSRLPTAPADSADMRVVLSCRLMTPEGTLDVVTTHLAWRPDHWEARVRQAELILDAFTREGFGENGHRGVLAGDLNATEDEPVIARIGQTLRDAWRELHPKEAGYTWFAGHPYTKAHPMPSRRLDYVFVPRGAVVHRAEVVLDRPDPVWPSDHAGVLVQLSWPSA